MKKINFKTHFKETSLPAKNTSAFEVILIQEGLGNLKDCFYYTKEALQSSASIFEGKKCYADHPSSLEENIRPERSTRDILGYYTNCQYREDGSNRGQIAATLVTVVDPTLSWANSLLSNAIQYAQQYPNSDFVGVSINASGDADEMPIEAFMQQNTIPSSVMPKLQEAISEGINTIRVVSALKDAISCDLVTDAGAGGKILKMIESSKENRMKKVIKETGINPKDNMEAGEDGKGQVSSPMASGGPGQGTPDHADAAQDVELFKQLISQYLDGAEGVDEEEAMEMAKHAHETAMEAGMSHEEAMQAAGKHLQMAHSIGKKMSQCKQADMPHETKEAFPPAKDESHDDEMDDKDADKKKVNKQFESMRRDLLRANAQNAKLSESLRKYELIDYLDKKMSESKQPNQLTKKFREALGPVKNKDQIDQYWKFFLKAHEGIQTEEVGNDFSSCVLTEKNSFRESQNEEAAGDFGDCLS